MFKKDALLFCKNGVCVDITSIKCDEEFNKLIDIMDCEELKAIREDAILL